MATVWGGAVAGVAAGAVAGVGNDSRRRLLASITDLVGSGREARWIVEHVEAADTGCSTEAQRAGMARALAGRRAAGEPLQYVLGRWPFRSLELQVDPRVLIPRPETEQVVEVALAELSRMRSEALAGAEPARNGAGLVCVDLGTGSGAIALSLAAETSAAEPSAAEPSTAEPSTAEPSTAEPVPGRRRVTVWATDVSPDALEVARLNLGRLSATDADAGGRVRLAEGSWFEALPTDLAGIVDLLVSNPPYVSETEYPGLDPQVHDWEPHGALVAAAGPSGVGGMAAIEAIVSGAPGWMRPTGTLVVELAPHQADAAVGAAHRAGFARARVERDLAGRLRTLVASR